MKIVKILSTLAAVCALVIGCAKSTPLVWDEIQVSSSYVGLPKEGGSNTITVTAKDSWTINEVPNWLTISPTSGSAGMSSITFTAPKALSNNESTVKIVCAGKEQRIIVKQLAEVVEPKTLTVSEAVEICNALADKEVAQGDYRVKGVVCSLVDLSVQYGNVTFWISDDGKNDGNKFEVYRALWLNGAKFKAGDNLDVGDEVIIEGKIMRYGSTPESKEGEAYVYQINKSLIKCDSLVFNGAKLEALPIEGGEFEAILTCKGNGVSVNIPDDAKSWLSITGIQTTGEKATVTFNAAKNEGGDRSVDLTFVTASEGKEYSASATLSQVGAIAEVSVADFLAAPVGSAVFKLSGVITSVANSDYGNFYLKDYSGEVYVYGLGAKGDFKTLGLKEGDIITITGTRAEYKGTAQVAGGQYEIHKYVTPMKAADVASLADDTAADPQNYIMLTGVVANGTDKGQKFDLETYGNFDLVDDSGDVYVYGVSTGWGGETKKFGTLGVKEGDIITIVGYKTSYKGTVEVVGMYVSHVPADN